MPDPSLPSSTAIMVLILDGTLEIDAQVRSNVIWSVKGIRLDRDQKQISGLFSLKKLFLSFYACATGSGYPSNMSTMTAMAAKEGKNKIF